MTNLPDDRFDPYESRLARRVSDFSEQAVRPIDAAAIAAAARAGAQRQTLSGRVFGSSASMTRLGVLFAGVLVAAAAFGIFINAGGANLLGPKASTSGPIVTSTTGPAGSNACTAAELTGSITAWEGAAGHRLATIEIRNGGSTDCQLRQVLQPELVDGSGRVLITGAAPTARMWITFPPGAHATSMVDMANYCGASPDGALKVRLYLDSESFVELSAASNVRGVLDPPPCNGSSVAAEIQMEDFRVK